MNMKEDLLERFVLQSDVKCRVCFADVSGQARCVLVGGGTGWESQRDKNPESGEAAATAGQFLH